MELAAEIERRGFSGIWCPSYGDCMALCQDIGAGERDRLPSLKPDHWLDDVTLSGSASQVRDGVERWQA